jgi:hypothetical protein
MPFVSEKQRRYFHWRARRDPTWAKRAKKWEAHTPSGKLPEKVSSVSSFGDEFVKIAVDREVQFQPHVVAHELGHAHHWKDSGTLRGAARGAGSALGTLGAVMAARKGKLGLAALAGGLGAAPTLLDEAQASLFALERMKKSGKYSEEELSRACKDLGIALGTYATGVGAGTAVGMTVGRMGRPARTFAGTSRLRAAAKTGLPALGLAAANIGLMSWLLSRRGKGRTLAAKDVKKHLGVDANVFHSRKAGPIYLHPPKGPFARKVMEHELSGELPKKQLKKLSREGGILLPRTWGRLNPRRAA